MTAGSMPVDDSRRVWLGLVSSMIRSEAVSSPRSSAAPCGDRVEHLADGLAVGDRLLDAEEALEERPALLEDGDEALVLLHVAQRFEPQGPFVVEGPEHPQRLGQHPAHAPQQHRLVGGERVAGAGDEEGGGGVDGDGQGGAVADAGDVEDGQCAVGPAVAATPGGPRRRPRRR